MRLPYKFSVNGWNALDETPQVSFTSMNANVPAIANRL